MGLAPGSKLLNNLKAKIVHLASSAGIISTVQQAAQAALQAGWSILLPTASERAETLTSLLSSTGNVKIITYSQQLLQFSLSYRTRTSKLRTSFYDRFIGMELNGRWWFRNGTL